MHNLLRFIKINHFLLLFLTIESFSIFLLIYNNNFQSNKFLEVATQCSGTFYNYTSTLKDYVSLKEVNELLIKENAKLSSLIDNKSEMNNEIEKNYKYRYISAKVIKNSINNRNNYITINKGIRHGLKKGMGVITQNGVIGIIHSISKNYSIVLSMLHKDFRLGIRIKKNNHNGLLSWNGFKYRFANINNLPVHIPIKKGDTIVTNGYSTVFPENINIGNILNFKENKSNNYWDVSVSLFEDFNQLNYVYVVYSKGSSEQVILEESVYER